MQNREPKSLRVRRSNVVLFFVFMCFFLGMGVGSVLSLSSKSGPVCLLPIAMPVIFALVALLFVAGAKKPLRVIVTADGLLMTTLVGHLHLKWNQVASVQLVGRPGRSMLRLNTRVGYLWRHIYIDDAFYVATAGQRPSAALVDAFQRVGVPVITEQSEVRPFPIVVWASDYTVTATGEDFTLDRRSMLAAVLLGLPAAVTVGVGAWAFLAWFCGGTSERERSLVTWRCPFWGLSGRGPASPSPRQAHLYTNLS